MIETVTVLTDDIDKTTRTNVSTVRFALDGAEYEMELGTVNRKKLDAVLAQYIPYARRAPVSGTRNGNGGASASGARRGRTGTRDTRALRAVTQATNEQIRAWAKAQGIDVKERGRIPAEVVDRHHASVQARAS